MHCPENEPEPHNAPHAEEYSDELQLLQIPIINMKHSFSNLIKKITTPALLVCKNVYGVTDRFINIIVSCGSNQSFHHIHIIFTHISRERFIKA